MKLHSILHRLHPFFFLSCCRLHHGPGFYIARPASRRDKAAKHRAVLFCRTTSRGVRVRKEIVTGDDRARVNVDRACRGVPAAECGLHIPVSRERAIKKRKKKKRKQRVWFRPRLHDSCWEDARRGGQQHGSDAGFVSLESGNWQSSWDAFQLSG